MVKLERSSKICLGISQSVRPSVCHTSVGLLCLSAYKQSLGVVSGRTDGQTDRQTDRQTVGI